MADEDIYENEVFPKIPAPSLHPKRSAPMVPLLIVLVLLLAISLVTLAVLCARLLDAQQLRNGNEAFLAIQAHLETILASQAEAEERNRVLLELLCNGWTLYNGSWYFFSKEKKSWWEAEEACVSHGAHLTSVTSKKEMEYILRRTKQLPFWIGLTDQQEEGNWTWVDGTPYSEDVSFWESKQPDNWQKVAGYQEDCVQVRSHSMNSWNDINCTFQSTWICKKIF